MSAQGGGTVVAQHLRLQQLGGRQTVPSTATEGGHPRPLGGGDTLGDFSVIVFACAYTPCPAAATSTWRCVGDCVVPVC